MYTLPIPFLLVLTIVTSYGKSILGGYFNKKVANQSYYTWFFGFLQSLFCSIGIVFISLFSGGFGSISLYTVLLGGLMGLANILSLITMMMAYNYGPFSYTSVIVSLSTVIPALSGLFFGEQISAVQYVGIGCMIFCLILSPEKVQEQKKAGLKWLTLAGLSAVFCGMLGVMQKLHQNSEYSTERAGFLISAFAVSTLLSGIMTAAEAKKGIGEKPQNTRLLWIVPIASGLIFAFPHTVNLFLSGVLDAVVMFPLVNLCPMIMSMVSGMLLFQEKLTPRRWVGLCIGLLATVLVSGIISF